MDYQKLWPGLPNRLCKCLVYDCLEHTPLRILAAQLLLLHYGSAKGEDCRRTADIIHVVASILFQNVDWQICPITPKQPTRASFYDDSVLIRMPHYAPLSSMVSEPIRLYHISPGRLLLEHIQRFNLLH